jgi:GTP-binding protein YchF
VVDLGIIGLERSGKTSFFNAVTGRSVAVGGFAGGKPNVGVAHVPDPRLDAVAEIVQPKKKTYAEVRWVDYPAGFGAGAPGAQFLAELAGMDALVHVVRGFEDPAVPHPQESVDAARDLESLDLELAFADLALIERRLERIAAEERSVRAAERGALERDRSLLLRLQQELEGGTPVRAIALDDDDRRQIAQYQFVTRVPLLPVLNIGEDDVGRGAELEAALDGAGSVQNAPAVALCARLEAEVASLEPDEAAEFRAGLGLEGQPPLDRAIRTAYEALGLITFFTAGDTDCRAWALPRGEPALAAAGRIHSDIERGFIRAEVAGWQDLLDAGSYANMRSQGRLRTEGKTYEVQDGDVINVLFNV